MNKKTKLILIIIFLISLATIISGVVIKYIDDNKPYDKILVKDTPVGSSIIEKLQSSPLIKKYKEDGYKIDIQNVTTSIAIRIKKDNPTILRFSLEDNCLVTNYIKDDELKYKIIIFVIASLEGDEEKVVNLLQNNILTLLTKEEHGVEIKNNKLYIYYNELNVKNFSINLEEN